MERKIGRVIEIFIPEEENIDIMQSNKIGFKVLVDDGVITIIEEQNDTNTSILRESLVLITKQNISGKEYMDIELLDGEE